MKGKNVRLRWLVLVLLAIFSSVSFAVVSSDITADWIPTGVTATNNWTYGYEPIPGGAFTQYGIHATSGSVYDIWWNGSEPWIAKAGSGWGWVTIPGYIIMHPGPTVADGGDGSNQCSVARFTASVAGTYGISGSFNGRVAGSSKDVYVQKNGVTLWSKTSLVDTNSAAFALTSVALAVGDQVDFIIKGTTSYAACATILCATLTKQFTPSTSSWDATADYYPQIVMPTQTTTSFGPWSLGYLPVNGGVGNFVAHTRKLTRVDDFDEFDNGTDGEAGFSVLYNFNYGQVWWYKTRPNWSFSPLLTGYPCIRFVAPQDGQYTVSCSFSGVAGGAYQVGGDANSHSTTKAHIDTYVNGVRTSLFSADVNGFDGTGLVNVTDLVTPALSSPAPVYATANLTNVNLAQGNAIEFYADPRGNSQYDNTYVAPAVTRTGNYVPTCAERGVYVPMDFNHDCYVNFKDFASFAAAWLNCSDPRNASCTY